MKPREIIAWVLIALALIVGYYQVRIGKAENKSLKEDIKAGNVRFDSLQKVLTAEHIRIDSLSVVAQKQDSELAAVIIPQSPQYHVPKVSHPTAPDSVSFLLGAVLQGLH